MAKVTAVSAGGGHRNKGTFHVESFNLFEEDGCTKYAELRTRAADKTNGIEIEQAREYSRKTVTIQGEGDSHSTVTTEEIILVVHYWEKPIAARPKGESHEEAGDAKLAVVR